MYLKFTSFFVLQEIPWNTDNNGCIPDLIIQKSPKLQIKEFEGVYTVSGWVDSQNSYGAMIRTPFTLKMKNENGKIVSTTNINMLGSKQFAANYFTYLLFGIIITAILFGISYFFISGMF